MDRVARNGVVLACQFLKDNTYIFSSGNLWVCLVNEEMHWIHIYYYSKYILHRISQILNHLYWNACRILRKNLEKCFVNIFDQWKSFQLIDMIPGYLYEVKPRINSINRNDSHCSKIITEHWPRFCFLKFGIHTSTFNW